MAAAMEEKAQDWPAVALHRGTNQAGMRAYNERLVLSLVRRHGALAKTEIARMTGLSAQTVSVIMRHLESDRLLMRGEPQRGRVGQPSVPMSLNPAGAYFLGAKVGRRSLDFVLVDFQGQIRHSTTLAYMFPKPRPVIERILAEVAACEAELGAEAARIAGLGIAMPFALWSWADEIGADPAEMNAWQRTDIRAELAARRAYPVYLQNDATAACGAELVFGNHADLRDFVYFYIGTFIGGGLVLNRALYVGRTGNAAALGSTPIPAPGGGAVQLIDLASLVILERRLRAAGLPAERLYDPEADWSGFDQHFDVWMAEAARGIAHAIAGAAAMIDLEAAVLDGAFPVTIQDRLLARVDEELHRLNLSGIDPPQLRPGTIGPIARALGGASLPLFDRYLVDQTTLTPTASPRG